MGPGLQNNLGNEIFNFILTGYARECKGLVFSAGSNRYKFLISDIDPGLYPIPYVATLLACFCFCLAALDAGCDATRPQRTGMPDPTMGGVEPKQSAALNTQFILVAMACWAVPVAIIMIIVCLSMPMRGPDASLRVRMRKREPQSTQPSDGRRHVTLSPIKPD